MPILDGAPNFVLLAFTIALAAFLRVIGAAGQDLIDKLEGGADSAPFPYNTPDKKVREKKMNSLAATHLGLRKVTRVLFIMLLFLTLRLVVHATARIGWVQASSAEKMRDWFDFIFVLFLLVFIVLMWIMYGKARDSAAKIRSEAVESWQRSRQLNTDRRTENLAEG